MTQLPIRASKLRMSSSRDHLADSAATQRHEISGGTIPGVTGTPAFTLHRSQPSPLPILIAVPHAGRSYPDSLVAALRQPAESAIRLEDRHIDVVGRAVARATGAALLVAHAPRAAIDLNRAPEDIDWDMVAGGGPAPVRTAAGRRSRSGLGLIPRRLPGIGELWRGKLGVQDLSDRIAGIHQPYHLTLARTLEHLRDRWGAALLIDLHSMPPLGPKHGPDGAADFVLGDRFGASCESGLVRAALDYFDSAGRRAAHNRPYAGGYVLDRHASPVRGLHALQVEVCRSAYLEPSLREPGDGLEATVALLSGLVRRLADELRGDLRSLSQAAE